ncbi:hypothetical protein EJ08DRAFT_73804 [Tothia fuscella]|uniref:Uncharacterized protein n=1 Tax=Tothia fuscella TaxID=1048955 RepID=A0A9P4NY48_9PEZI|nr:hypothetical protein EJ08DRAFT_73804 [Tothia fuscella]
MDPEGQSIWNGLTGFCSDCTVLYGSTYLSDVNGRRLEAKDGAYLHHSLVRPLSRLERPFWTCSEEGKPASKPMLSTSFFLAGSVETGDHWFTSTDGKSNSGYYLPKNSVYILQAEAINFKKTPQDWYVAAEIEYVPAKPSGLEVVTLAGISVSTCDSFSPTGSVYKPPKGAKQFNMTSPKFTMDRDLTLMRAVGHIHEGGVHNTLLLNDKLICKSDTVYGGSKVTFNREGGEKWESVSHMTPCEEPVQIKTGDVLRMTTYYDLDAHPIRQAHSHGQGSDEGEAMGMFSLFLAENEKDSRRFGS